MANYLLEVIIINSNKQSAIAGVLSLLATHPALFAVVGNLRRTLASHRTLMRGFSGVLFRVGVGRRRGTSRLVTSGDDLLLNAHDSSFYAALEPYRPRGLPHRNT